MDKKLRILALIPARGGSKGIKNKNIILLEGKPLISYTITAAIEADCFADIVVTTDSEEIAEIAKKAGAQVPFLRPEDLATDHSKVIDAILHALNELRSLGKEYDLLVLLQPTSPLRTGQHIADAVDEFIQNKYTSLVSVTEVSENPVFMRSLREDKQLRKMLNVNSTIRRQNLPTYYIINGAIYINWIKDLDATTSFNDNEYGYVMAKSHSLDINDHDDLQMYKIYKNETQFTQR